MTAAKSSRSDVLTFLGLLAGAYEDELLPGKDNLTPEALQNL